MRLPNSPKGGNSTGRGKIDDDAGHDTVNSLNGKQQSEKRWATRFRFSVRSVKPESRLQSNESMKKKHPANRRIAVIPRPARPDHTWHNGADIEIGLYARSLQRAAKVLLENLDRSEDAKTAWDVGPIMTLYKEAVELQIKFLVEEGGRFLKSPTDHLTLAKTKSLRWLGQIVCQVIRAVQWEAEFRCDGVSNLAAFRALLAELESTEPVAAAISSDKTKDTFGDVPSQLTKSKVLEVVPKLDAFTRSVGGDD